MPSDLEQNHKSENNLFDNNVCFVLFCLVFDNSYPNRYEAISHSGLMCKISNIKHPLGFCLFLLPSCRNL